jgi:membrane-associated progesterone receptor component
MDYVENRMAQGKQLFPQLRVPANNSQKPPNQRPPQKCKPHPPLSHPQSQPLTSSRQTIATPINFILLSLFLLILYYQIRPKAKVVLPAAPPPVVFKTFTPPTLLPYNGQNNMPVYLAVRGRVFDVTSGRNFYGPGGPYENFAGRDASRGLACGSFDEEMLTKDLQGPLDKLQGLGPDEMEALRGWEERFEEKYLVVGKLVAVGDEGQEVKA